MHPQILKACAQASSPDDAELWTDEAWAKAVDDMLKHTDAEVLLGNVIAAYN